MSVEPSPHKNKKWRANFYDKANDKRKHTDFGASGYTDFLLSGNIDLKNKYQKRHSKDLETNDPTRAGYLSMFLLWNKPTMHESISDYKRRFNM